MPIIQHKKIYLTISALFVIASIAAIAVFGFRQGVDFVGGTLWQLRFAEEVMKADIAEVVPGATITSQPLDTSYVIRMAELSEAEHQELLAAFEDAFPGIEELRFEAIGPIIGNELRTRAMWAFVFVLIGISLYIAFAFRKVSKPVSSWKYGAIALVTLFHDAVIPAGMMAVLGYLVGAEIDTNFVVALLVVMGFSVHDTIVVFDRIRENLQQQKLRNTPFDEVVNISVIDTLARSINTSLTLIFVLLAMYFLGAVTLSYFILVILVGTIVGTYSSVFLASPLLTVVATRKKIETSSW